MTKVKLNRDVQALADRYLLHERKSYNLSDDFDTERRVLVKEFQRLHDADPEVKKFGRKQILIMIVLHRKLRPIPSQFLFAKADEEAGLLD